MPGKWPFLLAAGIAVFGAAIHFAAPLLGPEWYAYLHAPPPIVASAAAGGWLAPVSTVFIGLLMLLAGLYAFSGAGLIGRLPLIRTALVVLSVLCVLRGVLIIPIGLKAPQLIDGFEQVAALIWLAAGLGFSAGTWSAWPSLKARDWV